MRPNIREYFLDIAEVVATRATCPRLHVGALIVRDKRIISTGYNGSTIGKPHCDDVGCDVVIGSCKRTVHAELNAILQAAKYGISVEGASMYVTHSPCENCMKHMDNAGIVDVQWRWDYKPGDWLK